MPIESSQIHDVTPGESEVGSLEAAQIFIEDLIRKEPVCLFMKGTAQMPQCGFSQKAAGLIEKYTHSFVTVNVLQNPWIRQGVKDYSDWPTIPQLYVKGEFIGGSDILSEMESQDALRELLSR